MMRYCDNQNSKKSVVISEGPLSIGQLEPIGFDPLEKRPYYSYFNFPIVYCLCLRIEDKNFHVW